MARAHASGFTLIEIMVVLVIASVITLFALISVRGGGEERLARDEAHRLERLVQLAADEALYRVIELGLEFHTGGYRFLLWDGAQWHDLPDPGALRARTWPDALTPTLVVEGRPIPLRDEPAVDEPTPQVVFLSSGEVSPFRLALVTPERRGEELRVTMTAQAERVPVDGVLP